MLTSGVVAVGICHGFVPDMVSGSLALLSYGIQLLECNLQSPKGNRHLPEHRLPALYIGVHLLYYAMCGNTKDFNRNLHKNVQGNSSESLTVVSMTHNWRQFKADTLRLSKDWKSAAERSDVFELPDNKLLSLPSEFGFGIADSRKLDPTPTLTLIPPQYCRMHGTPVCLPVTTKHLTP